MRTNRVHRELDLNPIPIYSADRRFLGENRATKLAAGDPWFPRPPAAASAAGGRGIHGSRRVHSLGVCGVLAGGAGVEAAVSVGLLVAAVFPSVGAAPVELRRGSGAPSSSAALRSAREDIPFAGAREMAGPVIDDLKLQMQSAWKVSPFEEQGGGAPAPRSVDSLVAWGSLPVQVVGGRAAGFAGAASFSETKAPELRKGLFVILCFPGLFCKIPA